MQYKSRISSGKVVILGHLGMPGHKHLKWQYQFKKKKNLYCLYTGKKSTSSFTFSLRYWKDIAKLLFWTLWGIPIFAHPKWYYQLAENFCVNLQAKKQLCCPYFSWYCKDMQTSCFGYLGKPGYAYQKR